MDKKIEVKPEVKMYCNNGERRLLWDKGNEPNANTILSKCPICSKPHRRRKTGQVPTYETYLQLIPPELAPIDIHNLYFRVWIRKTNCYPWEVGGEYKVRLDIWDDNVDEGGGFVRNPLLNELHWHREEPK